MITLVAVAVGAAVGAPMRYLLDRAVQGRHESVFPWGTLTVNVTGCFVLGGLVGAEHLVPGPAMALLGTGFCGALTTYSTFSFETWRLLEDGHPVAALGNAVGSVVAGVLAACVGYAAATALLG